MCLGLFTVNLRQHTIANGNIIAAVAVFEIHMESMAVAKNINMTALPSLP